MAKINLEILMDEEKREAHRRVQAFTEEYMAVPVEQRSEFVLGVVNEALINEGLAPLERFATDEEIQAAIEKRHAMVKKAPFHQRLRRAWAILWDIEA